jgi:hypothetical protein
MKFLLYRFLFSVNKIFNINKLATEFVAFEYELGIISAVRGGGAPGLDQSRQSAAGRSPGLLTAHYLIWLSASFGQS